MFQKGKSGNPGGRPKDLIAAILREHFEDEFKARKFVTRMIDLFYEAEKDSDALSACSAILDRAYGKPVAVAENHNVNEHKISGIRVEFVKPSGDKKEDV